MSERSIIEGTALHADLLSVMHINAFEASGEPGWSEQSVSETIQTLGIRVAVALIGETPAGFAMMRTIAGESEILTLCVMPDQQSKGIGKMLMRQLIAWHREASAEALFLEVRSDNAAAIQLYQNFGFQRSGQRADYFKMLDGSQRDAIIMHLP